MFIWQTNVAIQPISFRKKKKSPILTLKSKRINLITMTKNFDLKKCVSFSNLNVGFIWILWFNQCSSYKEGIKKSKKNSNWFLKSADALTMLSSLIWLVIKSPVEISMYWDARWWWRPWSVKKRSMMQS